MKYYLLIHRAPGGPLHYEIYTVKGNAEADLRRYNHYGVVITCENPLVRNYGLCDDLTDHIDEL